MSTSSSSAGESGQQVLRKGMEAFASHDFSRYQAGRLMVIMGAEAQAVAVAWHVYSITHRALDLGYTGLALFLPGLLFLLPAGHIADRFDRREVILACYRLQLVASALLLWLSWQHMNNVYLIYAVLFVIGSGRAFSFPASSALLPHLVEEKHFVNAVTWGAVVNQLANVIGPALGGLLFTLPVAWLIHVLTPLLSSPMSEHLAGHLVGPGIVYVFTLATLVWFLLLVGSLKVRPGRQEHRAVSLDVLLAGFKYVWNTKILLGAMSLDLFVVLLGGMVALLPIYVEEILHSGPRSLGILRAAPGVGAMMVSLVLARFPMKRRAGLRMFACEAIVGVAIICFALSRNVWLSLLVLMVYGAADMISVVVRSSVLQLATPSGMRGRVSAVNAVFIGASNELGEFESGLTAHWWGAVRATVVGGVGALLVTGAWLGLFPALRRANALTAEALRPQTAAEGKEAE